MINIGDKVTVIQPNQTYPSYRRWLDKYVKDKELKERWDDEILPTTNRQYIVLTKGKHGNCGNMLYYIQNEENKKCYIIDEKGIQIEKEFLKIKVGDIVKLKKDTTLEKLTNNLWCGCQISTMILLTKLSFEDFNEQMKVVKVSKDWIQVQHSAEEFMIRKDIFEIVKESSILDNEEKRYLEAVIRPFKSRVINITKEKNYGGDYYISIELNDAAIDLPLFKKGTMYNSMEIEKKYTLKELGLDE